MSNNQNRPVFSDRPKPNNLHICLFSPDKSFTQLIRGVLTEDHYVLMEIQKKSDFLQFVESQKEQIDCLVFLNKNSGQNLLSKLKKLGVILPTVIVNADDYDPNITNGIAESSNLPVTDSSELYHSGEIQLDVQKINKISSYINFAISQFLNLSPSCSMVERSTQLNVEQEEAQNFLILQQRRLAEKLKERLGYLGVYYKRNPQDFYRNLQEPQRLQLIQDLTKKYCQIILTYFNNNPEINQLIDNFVNQAFFADISISQILEMHMELMDEFAQQLKLEGRSEEILLDYRLALIDIIAHLCEMYRRSIPREDIPLDVLLQVD